MKLTVRSMSFDQDADGRLRTHKRDHVLIDNEASAARDSVLRQEGGDDQPDLHIEPADASEKPLPDHVVDITAALFHEAAGESMSGLTRTFVHRQTGRTFTGLVRLDRVVEGPDVVAEYRGVRCWIVDAGTPQPDGPQSRLLPKTDWYVYEHGEPATPDQCRTASRHAQLVRTNMFHLGNTLVNDTLTAETKGLAVGACCIGALSTACQAMLTAYGEAVPEGTTSVDGTEALLQLTQSHAPQLRFRSNLWDIGGLVEGTKGLADIDAFDLQEDVRQDVAHLMDLCGLRIERDPWTVSEADFR